MSEQQVIRLKQRFENYEKAVFHLEKNIQEYSDTTIDVIKAGIIQHFELAHELAWKLMQDILKYEGESDILGSRTATRLAFNRGLISDGRTWLDMIDSRNKTVHTYDDKILNEEFKKVVELYLPLFIQFRDEVTQRCLTLD
ncbi:nucleotidyltransferase substrate binding protein [Actinobacillus porcinus]|uniref:nucleotidyltransferase substrate binding protein n=1 Tax=Actinobacillus porcinus TaxID=51048 RepID=UPI002354769A|nr:nucleotidyltransferase substrate binding protein [Actinobacillus porcinus]